MALIRQDVNSIMKLVQSIANDKQKGAEVAKCAVVLMSDLVIRLGTGVGQHFKSIDNEVRLLLDEYLSADSSRPTQVKAGMEEAIRNVRAALAA